MRLHCTIFFTIDDDLYGTRAADNQVKTLGHRKAVAERHAEDFIADVSHEATLDVRFRRRGEKYKSATALAVERLVETRCDVSRSLVFATADRGYVHQSFVAELQKIGM